MASGRTIAIGDIHGCAFALETLLGVVDPTADDTVVMLGDAIDRGPDSRNVLDQLLELQTTSKLISILGNHEQMLLDAVDGLIPLQEWLVHGGAETLDSYGKNFTMRSLDPRHVAFLQTWGDVYETADHFFVHGNYLADQPLDAQPWEELRWESLRVRVPGPHTSGKIAIVGHTSNKQGRIVNLGHLVCLDTYCHGGGWLTALEPTTGHVWQTDQHRRVREVKLPPVQKADSVIE
jgi:Calcineurin-like phosphoesterase